MQFILNRISFCSATLFWLDGGLTAQSASSEHDEAVAATCLPVAIILFARTVLALFLERLENTPFLMSLSCHLTACLKAHHSSSMFVMASCFLMWLRNSISSNVELQKKTTTISEISFAKFCTMF